MYRTRDSDASRRTFKYKRTFATRKSHQQPACPVGTACVHLPGIRREKVCSSHLSCRGSSDPRGSSGAGGPLGWRRAAAERRCPAVTQGNDVSLKGGCRCVHWKTVLPSINSTREKTARSTFYSSKKKKTFDFHFPKKNEIIRDLNVSISPLNG